MTALRNTYKAYERLKREQHIDTLFRTGKAFSVYPLKFIWSLVPRNDDIAPVRAGVAVPKKKFRRANRRHRVRRLVTEAWRLNKHILYNAIPAGQQLHVFMVYVSAEEPDFSNLQAVVQQGIQKLMTLTGGQDA